MMYACSVIYSVASWATYVLSYTVAYIRSLIYSVASWATCFAVSVPAQVFHFSPIPQLYMQNVNLGSRL